MYTGFWWENLREEDHLEDPGVGGRITLKWIFEKWDGGMEWIDLAQNIATRYWLDGLGIGSRWGQNYLQPSTPAVGPTQSPTQRESGLFPEDKAAGAWR